MASILQYGIFNTSIKKNFACTVTILHAMICTNIYYILKENILKVNVKYLYNQANLCPCSASNTKLPSLLNFFAIN